MKECTVENTQTSYWVVFKDLHLNSNQLLKILNCLMRKNNIDMVHIHILYSNADEKLVAALCTQLLGGKVARRYGCSSFFLFLVH